MLLIIKMICKACISIAYNVVQLVVRLSGNYINLLIYYIILFKLIYFFEFVYIAAYFYILLFILGLCVCINK